MLSIKEILVKEPYASFEETQEIKRYIEEKIFETGIVDRVSCYYKKEEKFSFMTHELLLSWDYFHILMYEFIQKKINKQPYSLNSFKEGLEVITKANSKAKDNNENNSHFVDDRPICFDKLMISWTDYALDNQYKEYEEIPSEHCVLWGLCKRFQRSHYFWDSSSFKEWVDSEKDRIECFEAWKPQIKDDVVSQLGDSTYTTFVFSSILSDNKSISIEVFLLLDESDGKSIIFEPINFDSPNILDLIFHMFFYAYWHNKSFLTKIKLKNKIEKFGFLYHGTFDEDEPNIFEHKLPKELTILFDKLHKKIKEKSFSKTTNKEIVIAWWKKNFNTICSAVAAIVSVISWIRP